MRILFIGDVMGRSGRDAVFKYLPDLKGKLRPDTIIVNVDNAAHGFGTTIKICDEFLQNGIDCLTGGNHIWDQREIVPFIEREPRLLRTQNYPPGVPGQGHYLKTLSDGRSILTIHLMGRIFMDNHDDPFRAADEILRKYLLGSNVSAVFVDVHAEATSEKMALAQYLNGRVSAVIGTHTHLPTADCMILSRGTGFQGDAGMTGDFDSVIGMKSEIPLQRFTRQFTTERMSAADGEATLCGTFVVTDDRTGQCLSIEPVRLGPRLANSMPVN